MAEDGAKIGLGDLFKAKNKKKVPKSTNLNATSNAPKADEKKSKKKDAGEWADEDDVGVTELAVAALQNFKDEEKKEDDSSGAQAWGGVKKKAEAAAAKQDARKFPSLAHSMTANPKAMVEKEDGAIKINKNAFDALDDQEDELEAKAKKGALVNKVRGERQEDALKRAKDEFTKAKKEQKKRIAKERGDSSDESSEEEVEEEASKKAPEPKKKTVKKTVAPKEEKENTPVEEEDEEAAEDTTIEPDLVAARAKYADRLRQPLQNLPRSELEKQQKTAVVSNKKKKAVAAFEEDDKKSKLMAMPDDW